VSRQPFPTWFDPQGFRDAFTIEPCGLPLIETQYRVVPIDSRDGDGVDVFQEYVDENRIYRVETYRRIRDIGSMKVATHAAFYVLDDPRHRSYTFQRNGIAKRALRRILPLYDRLGVSLIELAATLAGREVWPSFGFRIASAERARFERELGLLYYRSLGTMPAYRELPVAGPDIVAFRPGGHAIGITALLARDAWAMDLDLTDPQQRGILEVKCR
jgi:GNAT superfamily N-acetyltransferase